MKKIFSLLIIQLFLCSFTSNLSWGLGTQSTFQAKPSSNNRITKLSTQAKTLGSKVTTSLNRNKKTILRFTFLLTFSCLNLTFFGLSAFIAFGMISLPSYAFYILIVLGLIVSIPFSFIIFSRASSLQTKINNSSSSSYSKKIHYKVILFLIIFIINILYTLIILIFSILFFNNLLSVAVGATLIGSSILMALLLTPSIICLMPILISTIRKNKQAGHSPTIIKILNNTSEFLWIPITQFVSNIIFLSIFTCSVLMIFNIIPLASLSPVAFSFLPYFLISISLLFHFVNCISFFVKKYKESSKNKRISKKPMIFSHLSSKKNTLSLALIVIQTLVYLGGNILILIFYTFFSTMTLPIFVATSAYILALLTVTPLFYLSIASYKYRHKLAKLDKLDIWDEPIKVSIKKIKNNIRFIRSSLYKSSSEPDFFSEVYPHKPLPGNTFLKYLERKKRQRKFMSLLDDHLSKRQKEALTLKNNYKSTVKSFYPSYRKTSKDPLSIRKCLTLSPADLLDKHYLNSESELPIQTVLDNLLDKHYLNPKIELPIQTALGKLNDLNAELLKPTSIQTTKTIVLNLQNANTVKSSS